MRTHYLDFLWWVFTSQCSSREWAHPSKTACYPKHHPCPFSLQFGWTVQSNFSTVLKDTASLFGNSELTALLATIPKKWKCKLKSRCRPCYESKALSMCRSRAPSQFTHSINKYLLSPLHDFGWTDQPPCASVSSSVNWG